MFARRFRNIAGVLIQDPFDSVNQLYNDVEFIRSTIISDIYLVLFLYQFVKKRRCKTGH